MIIKILAAGLAAALVCAPAWAATPINAYRLSPVVEGGKITALSITLTLPADADGETRLELPDAWGGGEKLWRFVKDPVVTGGTLSVHDEKTWVVRSKPGAPLTVRYRVVSAYDGEPPVDSVNYGQPIVGPAGFYVIGHTVFIRPEGRDNDRARFAWDPAGSDLVFASDLEPLIKAPGKLDDLLASVAVAYKDLTILTRQAAGAPLRLAARGQFAFTPEAFADMAAHTIADSRAFWGDGKESFLITLTDQDAPKGWTSYRGTGLGDAFAVISTRNVPLDQYKLFLAHEYFHTWNANRLGGSKSGPQEPAGYWFSEGFTDYYARRLSLRSGFVSLEAFVKDWNQALQAYGLSPLRAAPNANIVARFWSDKTVQKLPYHRGALFAVLMETQLKAKGGLDPVMLAMRDDAKGRDRADWDFAAANLFPRIAEARTGIDVTPELDRYITRGMPIALPPDAFGGCLTVETVIRPAYHPGFDEAATRKTRIVTGVVPDGPAWAAGLRDGQKYLGRAAGQEGDGSVETGQAVEDASGKRVIRYLPAGKTTVGFQRIAMPMDLTDQARAACVKAVAG
ncbi:M61 family peptidase [Caulobacter sp.]|uniref:M61 family metallopeptidase n=1 Tax=Caulobacter sp. TaxID=78 RepID=UPI001B2DCA5A|nr:M61 family peptidase [Caulobacter sp.]MBO9547677.1 M61 family metallopeptidase [Caulobacter sp.]